MDGIIYPENWKGIITNTKIVKRTRHVEVQELIAELKKNLAQAVKSIDNTFCMALSGGLDSSVLAVLLKTMDIKFTAITIGRSKQHPDIFYAQKLVKAFGLKHKIHLLQGQRESTDIYDDLIGTAANFGFKYIICADAIDEMLGGYWQHRKPASLCPKDCANKREWVFEHFWRKLYDNHLKLLDKYAQQHNVKVAQPYLGAYHLLKNVHISQRANNRVGKIILRNLAAEIGVPNEIIIRPKRGLCNAWDE